MNFNKLALALGAVAVAGAANAQVSLNAVTPNPFSLTGGYQPLNGVVAPTYAGSTTSLNLSSSAATSGGINGWNFDATATGPGGYISSVTFTLNLNGVTPTSRLAALNISALAVNAQNQAYTSLGPGFHLPAFSLIQGSPHYSGGLYTVTYSVASYHQHEVEFEFNTATLGVGVSGVSGGVTAGAVPEPASFAVFGFGAIGLLIRRRKNS